MDNKYKFQAACQIEKVETRADNTLVIKVGMNIIRLLTKHLLSL